MSDKNKILDLAKEYLNLSSEEDLAGFLGINLYELECIRNSNQPLSVENKLTILNSALGKLNSIDFTYEMSLLNEIESGYLFNSLCNLYSFKNGDFSDAINQPNDACFIEALRKIVTNDRINFNKATQEENICQFLCVSPDEASQIENGSTDLGVISKLRILNWIKIQEHLKLCNENVPQDPFQGDSLEKLISNDNLLIQELIHYCLDEDSDVFGNNHSNDSEILRAMQKGLGLTNNSELAELVGTTTKNIELINRDEMELTIFERINLILRVIDKDDLRQGISDQNLKNGIFKLEKNKNPNLTFTDVVDKYKNWNAKKVIDRLGISVSKDEKIAIRDSKVTISDLSALSKLKIYCAINGKCSYEFELAIKSNSYLRSLIENHRQYRQKKEIDNKCPYKPEGINRLFWLAAKKIAVPDHDFSVTDNVRFALSLYSGAKLKHISMRDMVNMVISALGEYYEYKEITNWELHELLNPLRTDYACLTNQTWNQDDASAKVISACMSRLTLAQVKDGDTVLVDLSGPKISYDELWEQILRDEEQECQEKLAKIHDNCRGDGHAQCLRMFKTDWLLKVTDDEKQKMRPDECLCEKVQDRPIIFVCDFKIDNSNEPVEIEFQ